MTIRSLHSSLKTSLMNYEPFIVAHLIKFEKPVSVLQYGGESQGIATDYTYITDAQYDITYQDGTTPFNSDTPHAAQIYRANKVLQLGTINESIQAKAASMSLTLDMASLGSEATISATFTGAVMSTNVDLSSAGFQEGDKILLTGSNNTNNGAYIRIDSFQNEGKNVTFTQISSIQANASAQTYSVSLASEELIALLTDKESASYTNYINREVLIYKAHINPVDRTIIGEPFLFFKGITSGASIQEKLDASELKWTLTSHWGDFIRVQGRLTDDSSHRALRSDGSPDLEAVIKKSYAGDLGFIHANTAINHIATYNTTEIEYKQVDINGGWPGGIRLREVEVIVPRTTDLQFNIQSKMLPVVYGVRKIDSFPIFVDTAKDSSATVWRADAICEGKIAGILDIHIEGNSTICLDKSDFDTRDTSGANYDAASVEVICSGRMDRGDTLAHYSAKGDTSYDYSSIGGGDLATSTAQIASNPEIMQLYWDSVYGTSQTGTSSGSGAAATGILHEGSYSITSPLKADFTFHQGLENQAANNDLVHTAAAQGFKVQNSYYSGEHQYWSPSHQLLDTAYVVGKYTIAEGETTLPDLEFVVRGRDPECYNYDYSYRQDNTYASATDGTVGDFILGDSVTLKKVNGNMADATVTIIDKWSTFDSDGNSDHRFRFSAAPILGTTTAFYMQKGTKTWHMQTWNHDESTGAPAGNLYHSDITEVAGTTHGRKFTLNSPSTIMNSTLTQDKAVIGLYKSSIPTLIASSYGSDSYSSNTLDNIGNFNTSISIDRVYVKNAIQLETSSASSSDDYYVGNKITLTHNTGTAPYVQERTIIDYVGSTKVAIVDAAWDYNYMPSTTTTDGVSDYSYSIGSIGDRRVTINPAMQVLDYMTNKRYGKGLDIDKDINLPIWISAAQDCDTRSDVTVAMSSSASIAEGAVYKYPATGAIQFMGTVKGTPAVLGGKLQVVFTNVIGKLGTKWNSWQSFNSGQLYWNKGKVYSGSGAVVATAPSSGEISAASLTKVSGTGTATLALDITLSSANGNPLVKAYSTSSLDYSGSGYTLYDGDDVKYWRYVGWDDSSQRNVTRHQMNQVVDTKLPLFDNINKMLTQFNGILRYTNGKYELEVKGKKGTVDIAEKISNEDIIGTIKLSDKGLKNSKNYVSTSIIDPNNKFEGRSVSFFNSTYLKQDKGIQKKGQFSLPGITNYFNARFCVKQYLDESRYGLEVQFSMAPRGLLLVAGSIVELTYPRFGYNSKLFRITNLNFKKDGTVDLTADEHDDNAYVVAEASSGSGITDDPQGGQNPRALPIPTRPLGLLATQTNQGEVILSWTNSDAFTSATHETEIYRATTNNFDDSSKLLIGTSTTNLFHDPITEGSGATTRYYWIRYMVRTPRTNLAGSQFRNVPSLYYPKDTDTNFTNGEGITGVGLSVNAVRIIKLSPGATQTFVYQNDETGIQSGYATTTTLSTSKTNDAGTVSYVWKKTANNGTVSVITGETGASYTYTPPNAFADMPETISVHMTDVIGSETFTATDSLSMSATKIVVNGDPGIDGYSVTATAGTFVFTATSAGVVSDVSNFASTFNVRQGATQLTYDASGSPATNTYKLGSFTNVAPAGSVTPVNTNGTVTINSGTGTLLSTGTSVMQATFDVPIIENNGGATVASFKISLTKLLSAANGTAGVKSALIYAYQRSATTLTSDAGDVTVNLNTGTITTASLANGWFKTIDGPTGSNPLYIIAASAAGTGSTDTIGAAEWTDPVILAQNGISPDALTVTSSESNGVTTLSFSNGTNATITDGANGVSNGVVPVYSSDATGTSISYTQGTKAYVNFYEWTGSKPAINATEITNLSTFVKVIGEDGDDQGVIPVYADDASGTNKNLYQQAGQEFILFHEWTVTAPANASAITGTWVKFIGTNGDSLTVTSSESNGVTTLSFSNGTNATITDGANGVSNGVVPVYSSDATGTSISYTQGTKAYVNFYEWTGSKPAINATEITNLSTFVKVIGEDGDDQGVIPVYADDASGTNKNLTRQSGQEFILFHEWTGTAPSSASSITGTWVKFIGTNGTPGFNSATVFIYKRTNSSTETTKPSGNTTYTFESGDVSFTTANGWSSEVPSGTDTYLWVRQATAAATTTTDVIADTEWSADALLLAQSGGAGVRGGSVFNFEESTDSNITAAIALDWADATSAITTTTAQAVAAAVIASASDSTLRPNDRITITDNSASKAGTRIYTAGAITANTSASITNYSSLVVQTFDGSVIVDGTLSADKLAANAIVTNGLKVESTIALGTSTTPGNFHSHNKSSYTSTNAGFFLGATGSDPYKLNVGDATNYIKWDGSTMTVAGTISMVAGTIGSTAVGTIESRANGANQDSTSSIQSGTTAANVGLGNVTDGADVTGNNTANNTSNVGSATASVVNTYGTTAGGAATGNSRAYMNNNGLVVVDGSGNIRVKIGNLSVL